MWRRLVAGCRVTIQCEIRRGDASKKFGFNDGLEEELSVSYFNVGVDHYFTDNFVFDIRFAAGLNETSDDFFTGVGGGLRF